MGRISRTIFWVVAVVVGAFIAPEINSAKVSATGKNFKYAGYRNDGKPHFILYGRRGKLDGVKVRVDDVLVDIFKAGCSNIEEAKDFQDLELYKINESYSNILKFWDDKTMTDCFISTNAATFDQATNSVYGDDVVKLRSKAMDVNGVGFDADYQNKNIHIRSNVNVVIRVNLFKSQDAKTEKKKDK